MSKVASKLDHDEVNTLLPAFIHGTLDSGLQRKIQEHVARCPTCAQEHRWELALHGALARTPAAVETLLTSAERERNRQRLLAGIDGAPPLGDIAGNSAQPSRRPPRYTAPLALGGMAAALLVALLLPAQLLERPHAPPAVYRTQTSAAPAAGAATGFSVRVVFQPGTDTEVIAQLLQRYDARLIDGPSPAGVYTLAFPEVADAESELLALLRRQPEIALAEKRVHQDG